MVLGILLLSVILAGCGEEGPESTVYRFLGGVQAQDFKTMESCIDPEAMSKAGSEQGGLARQWEELNRRYRLKPLNWRLEFEGIELECEYPETGGALVRIARGTCKLYDLKEDKWTAAGQIDFSATDFVPLYLAEYDGKWFLEALDLYIVNALDNKARN
ncbi:MAG: hypothetical protein A2Y75_06995 [Candidatus Solincola sediminis]|uniref:Uncharacterized protein n=1 Tax=Candidatus Solincola sediminis TaxID=1797199 RepID=A0A1F2WJ79_9ACTN|nr:MAG: hypothetical protein A2Y75_06995 [Candidatus Solincola sediminis]